MRIPSSISTVLLLSFFWFVYSRLITLFWSHYLQFNPILTWALPELIPDNRIPFYALLYTHDVLVNFIIVLPAGFLICKFPNQNVWLSICIAVVIAFSWDYRLVLFSNGSIFEFFSSFNAVLGAIVALGMLPLVYIILRRREVRNAT